MHPKTGDKSVPIIPDDKEAADGKDGKNHRNHKKKSHQSINECDVA